MMITFRSNYSNVGNSSLRGFKASFVAGRSSINKIARKRINANRQADEVEFRLNSLLSYVSYVCLIFTAIVEYIL